jgi:hypothetical protein
MNDSEQKSLKGTSSESTSADASKRPIRDKGAAAILLNPAITNAMAINRIAKMKTPFSPAVLAEALSEQIEKLNGGSLDSLEGILLAQTHTLDHVFVAMLQRALDAPTLEQGEMCMRLAFRAQESGDGGVRATNQHWWRGPGQQWRHRQG